MDIAVILHKKRKVPQTDWDSSFLTMCNCIKKQTGFFNGS